VAETTAQPLFEAPTVEDPSGVVRYTVPKMTGDGTLDPIFWQDMDVQSAGEIAEALPQPPQSDAEYQAQIEGSGSTGPDAPVISQLNCGVPVSDATDVNWHTDKEATTELEYGTVAGTYDQRAPGDTTVFETDHDVHLSGLTPATTYYVRVASRDADGNLATATDTFTTAA
jgi:hypothetical protein